MTVIVETGAGIAGANSYLSQSSWESYADSMGWDYSAYNDDQIEAALIRATAAIDMLYAARFPGVQTYESAQSLQWPRKAGFICSGLFVAHYPATVMMASGWPIPINQVPALVVKAAAEAAWRELQSPGVLMPDLKRGGAIKSVRAGSVGIEYRDNAPAGTVFGILDGIMTALLGGAASPYTGRVVRV